MQDPKENETGVTGGEDTANSSLSKIQAGSALKLNAFLTFLDELPSNSQ